MSRFRFLVETAVVNVPAPLLNPRLARDLATICLKCLEKEPEGRYGSADELAEDLDRFLKGEPVRARPISAPVRVWRWARRNPRIALVTAVAAAMIAALSLVYYWNFMVEYGRTQAALSRSLYEQALGVRRSGQPGSRWRTLSLLEEAERVRMRSPGAGGEEESDQAAGLSRPPDRSEIVREALAAILTEDARVMREVATLTRTEPDLSPNGEILAMPWGDGESGELGLRLVRLSDGRELNRIREPRMVGHRMALSADGKRLAVADPLVGEKDLSLWELPGGELEKVFEWPERRRPPRPSSRAPRLGGGPHDAARFAEYREKLDEHFARMKEYLARMEKWRSEAARTRVLAKMEFSPDGHMLPTERIVKSDLNVEVLLWKLQSDGPPTALAKDTGGGVALSAEWNSLAYPTKEGRIVLLDLKTQEKSRELESPLAPLRLAFGPDGKILAAAVDDHNPLQGIVLFWRLGESEEPTPIGVGFDLLSPVLAFSPDGSRLAIGDQTESLGLHGGSLCVLDLPTVSVALRFGEAHSKPVTFLKWRNDGHGLLSADAHRVKIWELNRDSPWSTVSTDEETRLVRRSSEGLGGARRPLMFAFSPDGEWLAASAFPARHVRMIRRSDGRVRREFPFPSVPLRIRFRSDSRQLAVCAVDRVHAWDVETGKEVARLERPRRKPATPLEKLTNPEDQYLHQVPFVHARRQRPRDCRRRLSHPGVASVSRPRSAQRHRSRLDGS